VPKVENVFALWRIFPLLTVFPLFIVAQADFLIEIASAQVLSHLFVSSSDGQQKILLFVFENINYCALFVVSTMSEA
jgi:hypothetical protein